MEKILITDSSDSVPKRVEEIKEECGALRHVTVFFENYNFITRSYELLSNAVHLILEFEEKEVQIESANCGYGGGGPNATLSVLVMLGLEKKQAEALIFQNDALDFDVNDHRISHIDTAALFFSRLRPVEDQESFHNKIRRNKNVSVDLEKKKIWIYNPQRTCWNGFLCLLSYMKDIQMEYYIGQNSPLEGGFYIGKGFKRSYGGREKPDIKGTEHVNLCLSGSNFSVICLIDRNYEVQVIEAVYLALAGECLFQDYRYQSKCDKKKAIKEIFRILLDKEQEMYDIVPIPEEHMER